MIEEIQTKYGITGLLILGVIYLLGQVCMWVFDREKKLSTKEKEKKELLDNELKDATKYNSIAIQNLTISVDKLSASISELNKIKLDTKRNYDGLKFLSGKLGPSTWAEVREEIVKENPPQT